MVTLVFGAHNGRPDGPARRALVSSAMDPGRRRLLKTAMAALVLLQPDRAKADGGATSASVGLGAERPRRVVVLDWGLAETLLALGAPITGMAEVPNYGRTVQDPPVPSTAVDVGLRLSPNVELMHELAPDLILINSAQDYMRASLARFGPVKSFEIYTPGGEPFGRSREVATALGALLGRAEAATELLHESDETIAAARAHLAPYDGRRSTSSTSSTAAMSICSGGAAFFRVSSIGSACRMPGTVLPVIGETRWSASNSSPVIRMRDSCASGLSPPRLERSLEVACGALSPRSARPGPVLPPLWAFGALPSAMRIARLFGEA